MTSRDLPRELTFLTDAAHGRAEFIEHASLRLVEGDEPYGTSYLWVGIRKLLDELLEEAADLGAWACLADEALDGADGISDLHREQIRSVLRVAARRGAQAHETISLARQSIKSKP